MTELLSTRCERAGPDEQLGLLDDLWLAIKGETYVTDSDERKAELHDFARLLAIGTDPAYLAAAMMLVGELPAEWTAGRTHDGKGTATVWTDNLDEYQCEAATPALALCAAVARSKGL